MKLLLESTSTLDQRKILLNCYLQGRLINGDMVKMYIFGDGTRSFCCCCYAEFQS